jgi:hypothetical protein
LGALSAVASFIARYGALGLVCIGISAGLVLFVYRPAISDEGTLAQQIDQHALIILGICVTTSLMTLLLFISKLFPSSEDLKYKYNAWLALRRCKKHFRVLSLEAKAVIADQLTKNRENVLYPQEDFAIQELANLGWIWGDSYGTVQNTKYTFDRDVWDLLLRMRKEARAGFFGDTTSDEHKSALEKVRQKRTAAESNISGNAWMQ